ncbi:MAG: hypothetical protein JO128_20745 [Alphaproteobacteria bacterium]|nr:hypothetical protein [Alphaproteobacteria bacterium]
MSSAGETIKEQAAHVVEPAKEKVRHLAEEQKAAGADRLDAVARAVHDAADRLEPELPRQASGYIHDAAGGIERASAAIRERSIDDLLQMATNFARRQPVAFLAGAVLTGFALTRFLKSSASMDRGPDEPSGGSAGAYDPGTTGGTAYGIPQGGTSTGGVNPGMTGPGMSK